MVWSKEDCRYSVRNAGNLDCCNGFSNIRTEPSGKKDFWYYFSDSSLVMNFGSLGSYESSFKYVFFLSRDLKIHPWVYLLVGLKVLIGYANTCFSSCGIYINLINKNMQATSSFNYLRMTYYHGSCCFFQILQKRIY